jgi:hypothetical protein
MDKLTPNRPNSLYAWRDAQRHRLAVTMLARQQALKEVGPTMAEEYLKKHRKRLTTEAAELIARSPELAKWRFPRR